MPDNPNVTRESVLNKYRLLSEGLGPKGTKANKSTVSFDIETVGNLQNRNNPLKVIQKGYHDPRLTLEQNLDKVQNFDNDGSVQRIINREVKLPIKEQFYRKMTLANKNLAGVDITAGGLKNGHMSTFKEINPRALNSAVGIYNLNFEGTRVMERLENVSNKTIKEKEYKKLKGSTYSMDKGVSLSNTFASNGGNFIGNDAEIAKLTSTSESLTSKFRAMSPDEGVMNVYKTFTEARDATIATAEGIAKKVTEGENILFDQHQVAKGYIAKMQKEGLIEGGDWSKGTSIDNLLKAAIGEGESHISSLDAGNAQGITSHMMGVLTGDEHTEITKSINANFRKYQIDSRFADMDSGIDKILEPKTADEELFFRQGRRTGTSTNTVRQMVEGSDGKMFEEILQEDTIYGRGASGIEGGLSKKQLFDSAANNSLEVFRGEVGETINQHMKSNSFITQEEVDTLQPRTVDNLYARIREKLKLRDRVTGYDKPVKEVVEEVGKDSGENLFSRMAKKVTPGGLFAGVAAVGVGFIGVRQMVSGIRSSKTDESAYGGFEVMTPNVHPDFPGGRKQIFGESIESVLDKIFIRTKTEANQHTHTLFLKSNPEKRIGYMITDADSGHIFMSKITNSKKTGVNHQGKGYGKAFYAAVLEKQGYLKSDSTGSVSVMAERVWDSLSRSSGVNLKRTKMKNTTDTSYWEATLSSDTRNITGIKQQDMSNVYNAKHHEGGQGSKAIGWNSPIPTLWANLQKKLIGDSATIIKKHAPKMVDILAPSSSSLTYNKYIQEVGSNFRNTYGGNLQIGMSNSKDLPGVAGYYRGSKWNQGNDTTVYLHPDNYSEAYGGDFSSMLDKTIEVGSKDFYNLQSTMGHELTHAALDVNPLARRLNTSRLNNTPADELTHTVQHYSNMPTVRAQEEIVAEGISVPIASAYAGKGNAPTNAAYGIIRKEIVHSVEADVLQGVVSSAKSSKARLNEEALNTDSLIGGNTHSPAAFNGINRSGKDEFDMGSRRSLNNDVSMAISDSMIKLGAGVAAIVGAREVFDFVNPNTYSWGRASQFGAPGKYMWGNVTEDHKEDMDARGMSIVTHGTYIHEELQNQIMADYPDIVSEYAVIDYKDKITGHIDMVAPIKLDPNSDKTTPIPIEIKTTSGKSLSSMTGPKSEHVAQSQFYLHHLSKKYKTNVPYEAFIYVDRDNPDKYKVFYEKRDERLYQRYLKRYRAYQKEGRNKKYDPQKMTSQLNLLKEQVMQIPRVDQMDNSPGMGMQETMDVVTQSAKAYSPNAYNNGINRSDSHYFDYDSPMKKVWNAPSAKLAEEMTTKTAPRITVVKPRNTTKIPFIHSNKRHRQGQSAKYSNHRPNSRSTNASRMGVA